MFANITQARLAFVSRLTEMERAKADGWYTVAVAECYGLIIAGMATVLGLNDEQCELIEERVRKSITEPGNDIKFFEGIPEF